MQVSVQVRFPLPLESPGYALFRNFNTFLEVYLPILGGFDILVGNFIDPKPPNFTWFALDCTFSFDVTEISCMI